MVHRSVVGRVIVRYRRINKGDRFSAGNGVARAASEDESIIPMVEQFKQNKQQVKAL